MHSSRYCVQFVRSYCSRLQSLRPITSSSGRLFACGRWKSQSIPTISTHHYSTADVIPEPNFLGDDKDYSPKIKQLVDEISQLTLIEVADLNELLKKTLNISDAPMMAMGAAAPVAAKEEEEPEEKKVEKVAFTVKLTGFDSTKKVAIIKQIKSLVSGMNLVQAKKFVESTPQVVRAEITKEEAAEIQKALEEVGGTVEVD